MFVNFGQGKCPICGDFGKKLSEKKLKNNFNCKKCNATFDNFYLFILKEPEEQNKFWN
jgi:transposase-like protein